MDIILLLREGGEHRSDESLTAESHNQTGFHPCAPTVASFILEQVESGVGGEEGTICLLALLQGCLANFPTQVCVNACAWTHLETVTATVFPLFPFAHVTDHKVSL